MDPDRPSHPKTTPDAGRLVAATRVASVNDMNSPTGASATVVGPHRWEGPLRSRPYMVVGQLPAAMAVPGGRGAGYWPVVHGLCQRNGRPLPEWVLSARSPVDVALVPDVDLASPYGQRLRENAPGVCGYHRVYFSVVDLRSR